MEPPRVLMARVEPEVDIRVEIVAIEKSRGAGMCLGIPGQIASRSATARHLAKVEVTGVRRMINIGLLEDEQLEAGDWV